MSGAEAKMQNSFGYLIQFCLGCSADSATGEAIIMSVADAAR